MLDDTIAAISTPMGEGAIAIVRLSGERAVEIADAVFRSPGKSPLASKPSHTIHYGHLADPATGQMIEEVMVSLMRAPKTFTREDVVEINCHGGIVSSSRVLQLLLQSGARLAEPGEFTKRAFLNGRIDLSQAEAVIDLIRAKTDRAMDTALGQMEGRLSREINRLRQALIETVAQVEVNIDYPEYDDVEEATLPFLLETCRAVEAKIDRLLASAGQGKILRDGLSTAIIGRPNVGKSSLLNALAQEKKAIVTDIAGTTRDVIEEYVNVRGVPLKLADTAGIRDTEDLVERIGVERSRDALARADLVLLMMDGSEPLGEEDIRLLELTADLNAILIINKTDLPRRLDIDDVRRRAGSRRVIQTALTEDRGIDQLEEAIASLFFSGSTPSGDLTYVSNARHIALLQGAKRAIGHAIASAKAGVPVDLVQIDITRTWQLLGEVIGDSMEESLLDQLFSQFCLGK